MSVRRPFVRFTGAALLSALLGVAACSAEGETAPLPAADAGALTPMPEQRVPEIDGGALDATTEAAAAKCGNHELEPGEACDDGNTIDGDGCGATCNLESAFVGDTCPGKTISLQNNGGLLTASITGSTGTAYDHYGSTCGGASAKDVVYTFTPTSSGKATIKVTAEYRAIVSARSKCDVSTSESTCAELTAASGGTTTLEVPVFQNTPVFLFVDGYGDSSGPFTLDIEVSQAVCGNGVAELPEACDDGNTTAGDGCSPTCTLEAGGVLAQCPGQPFLLGGADGQPRKISFAGNTGLGAPTQRSAGCWYDGGSNVVYALKTDVSGSAKVELTAGYAKANVHARSDCGADDFQLGCTQIEAPGRAVIDFPVRAGQWFYVLVDGAREGSTDFTGPYSLDVTVTPSACGNGVIDGDEECDDGNVDGSDGCSPSCTREPLPGVASCTGHHVELTPQADGSRSAVISSSTTGLPTSVESCNALMTSGRSDAVFEVTADIDGYLTADIAAPFNAVVSILSSCHAPAASASMADRTNVLACSYAPSASAAPYTLTGLGSVPKDVGSAVVAGSTYFVVVSNHTNDGSTQAGPFKLDLRLRRAVCGNGIIEGTEQCDDGGTDDDDGCDASCNLEPITSRSTCADAETITLTETAPGTYSTSLARGTTNLLANGNISSSSLDDDELCWAPGKNAFFTIAAPAAGVLRATAKSDAFDVVLSFQKPSCALVGQPFMCANDGVEGQEETLATSVAAGEIVYIVVDSKGADDIGRFTLDVSVTPSVCGDGYLVASPSEACDDGNGSNGDGCSATCKLEPIGNVDVCPGVPLVLTGSGAQPRRGTITFSTATLNADYAGACGGGSRDGVVKVVAPVSGSLRAKTRGMPDSTVYARTVCNDPSTEIIKSKYSTCLDVLHDTVAFQVTAGAEYFLFVDGLDAATGVPTLDVTIEP